MTKRSFAVIGLGRFGSAIATTLTELGHDVLGIDANEDRVARVSDVVAHSVQFDATDEKALRAAGIQDVDVAVISIGERIDSSLLVVMLVKELGIPTIIAKATTPLHGRILEKLGVSRVIFPERDMAVRVAHSLVVPNVLDYIELSRDFSIVEVPAPPEFVGRTLRELALRAHYGLTLIALRRAGQPDEREVTIVSPLAEDRIEAGDVLSLLGPNDRLSQLDGLLKA
ncbi:MAG: TrkA family potassium uptake protein [Acidobacteria bacterium]|nr:TrkA family potassium uptake protein [Acidobacteriota bacterium]